MDLFIVKLPKTNSLIQPKKLLSVTTQEGQKFRAYKQVGKLSRHGFEPTMSDDR